ncbi:type II toxin-antitoxin system VapC family toxin [Neosynechococcus sphagnicola]|uniref:type II toxin-antitoxin system VapC family toxin n=1 Tax=Neosynechococcus sphagnicola TaxID=1501145 RepID=UPI0005662520|nr:type II toxin-antitoxin system VapC family toxin [Neosynechococcus sphagnicola]
MARNFGDIYLPGHDTNHGEAVSIKSDPKKLLKHPLSAFNRDGAVQFIQQCYGTDNIKIVSVDTELLMQALALYQARPDKTWGLTDCISFVVMQQQNLTDAITGDRHFVQAGFRALMLETQ